MTNMETSDLAYRLQRIEERLYSMDPNPDLDLDLQGGTLTAGASKVERASITSEAASYSIYKDANGTVHAVPQHPSLSEFSDPDAATVINNAIEELPAQDSSHRSGKLCIKQDTYTITSTIRIYGQTVLEGEGLGHNRDDRGTRFVAADGLNDNVIQYGPFSNSNSAYFAEIRDLGITGNKANNTSGHGIRSDNSGSGGAKDLRIKRVFTRNCAEDGMNFDIGHGYRLSDCLSEYNVRDGLHLEGAGQLHMPDIYLAENTRHGAYLDTNACTGIVNAKNNGGTGLYIARNVKLGADNAFTVVARDNDTGVYVGGPNNSIYGVTRGNTTTDIEFAWSKTQFFGFAGSITNNGQKEVINGLSLNAGDPSAGNGIWSGASDEAYRRGATVLDTSTEGNFYIPLPPSATNDWIVVSGTAA